MNCTSQNRHTPLLSCWVHSSCLKSRSIADFCSKVNEQIYLCKTINTFRKSGWGRGSVSKASFPPESVQRWTCQTAPAYALEVTQSSSLPTFVTTQLGWALSNSDSRIQFICVMTPSKTFQEANFPHPIKGILRIFTSQQELSIQRLQQSSALLLHKFAAKCCNLLPGLLALSQRVHSPEEHFQTVAACQNFAFYELFFCWGMTTA